MGLFDQIVGAFTGSTEGATAAGPSAVLEMVAAHAGGFEGLMQKFQAAGLGDVVQSWIGTGQNLPISADMVHQVLGSDTMRRIAEQTGLPLDQVSSLISQHLPHAVDQATPSGEIPQGGTNPL